MLDGGKGPHAGAFSFAQGGDLYNRITKIVSAENLRIAGQDRSQAILAVSIQIGLVALAPRKWAALSGPSLGRKRPRRAYPANIGTELLKCAVFCCRTTGYLH